MNINPSFSQVQQMARATVQMGQAQNASKKENLRHIQFIQAKQDQAASKVVDHAVKIKSDAASMKGRIIDVMA